MAYYLYYFIEGKKKQQTKELQDIGKKGKKKRQTEEPRTKSKI